jgi:hypothetical protein
MLLSTEYARIHAVGSIKKSLLDFPELSLDDDVR